MRIKWQRVEPGEPYWVSVDGRFSLNPLYIGRQTPQKWEIVDNTTQAKTTALTLRDAQERADQILDPAFKPKTKSYVARGSREQVAHQMQDNYDHFIRNGQPQNAEVVRKNAEAVGVTLKTVGQESAAALVSTLLEVEGEDDIDDPKAYAHEAYAARRLVVAKYLMPESARVTDDLLKSFGLRSRVVKRSRRIVEEPYVEWSYVVSVPADEVSRAKLVIQSRR